MSLISQKRDLLFEVTETIVTDRNYKKRENIMQKRLL